MSAVLYDALERAITAIRNHPELAPCITVSQSQEALWVTPYRLEAPISALLTWHDAMEEQELEYALEQKGTGPLSWTEVVVRGRLDGVYVVASAVTFRAVNSPVDLAELKRLAEQERISLDA